VALDLATLVDSFETVVCDAILRLPKLFGKPTNNRHRRRLQAARRKVVS